MKYILITLLFTPLLSKAQVICCQDNNAGALLKFAAQGVIEKQSTDGEFTINYDDLVVGIDFNLLDFDIESSQSDSTYTVPVSGWYRLSHKVWHPSQPLAVGSGPQGNLNDFYGWVKINDVKILSDVDDFVTEPGTHGETVFSTKLNQGDVIKFGFETVGGPADDFLIFTSIDFLSL